MKKCFLKILLVIASVTIINAQDVWKTYYKKYSYVIFADNGNSLCYTQTTQLVQFDKASGYFKYTPMPYSVLPCNSDHNAYQVNPTALVADPQGRLWMATTYYDPYDYTATDSAGQLYYFDGVNWTSWSSNLTGAGFEPNLSPTFDRNGDMWFKSPSMGIVRYSGGTFTNWDTLNSQLPSQYITGSLVFDQNNNLWAGCTDNNYNNGGVFKFDGTTFTYYSDTAIGAHYPYFSCYLLKVSPTNVVYATNGYSGDYYYYTYSNGAWSATLIDTALTGIYATPTDLFFDSAGNNYMAFGKGIVKSDGNSNTLITNLPGYNTNYNSVSSSETDANGTVWLTVNGYFASYDFNNFTSYSDPRAVLQSNLMLSQVIDKNQDHWISYQDAGIDKIDPGYNFSNSNAPPSQGAGGGVLTMALDTSGNIWYGGGGWSPVFNFNPVTDSAKSYQLSESVGCAYNTISGIAIDKNNRVYVVGSTAGACGGFSIMVDDSLQLQDIYFLGFEHALSCIAVDSSNNVWLGSSYDVVGNSGGGIAKFDGVNYTNYNPSNCALPDSNIQSLAVDPTNRLWVGTCNHGFSIFDGNTWVNYDTSNSLLPYNHVEGFYFKNGNTLVATQQGFCVIDAANNWTVYTPQNSGLVDGDCESIVMDQYCNIWAATECGLSQLVGGCGNSLKILYGSVKKENGTPVPNTEVLLMKPDTAAGILKPIDNTITDAQGNYTFATTEPVVYVHPEPDPHNAPSVFAGYEDTALVQQLATAISMNQPTVRSNVTLHSNPGASGYLTLSGMVYNSGGGKPGAVHLYLVQNGAPVAGAVINVDGSFTFSNLASGTYSIWVDKMEVNNGIAPSVTLGQANGSVTAMLYPTYLQILTTGITVPTATNSLKIYPNPSTGAFYFTGIPTGAQIHIYNILGEQVSSGIANGSVNSVSLINEPKGVYFYRVLESNNVVGSGKIVVE